MQPGKWVKIAVASALSGSVVLGGHLASAAGFNLMEQNASGLGNAYAGAAAVAEDASTIYFNSAGLTQLSRPSLVLSVNGINIKSHFRDSGSAAALGQTLGSSGGNAGGLTPLPSLYIAVPLTDKITGGLGINAPFGLKTDYSGDWAGRFQAITSEVKTLNVNPALAFKLGNKVSLGIGADYQSLDATLSKGVNYTAAIAQVLQAQLLAGAISLAQFNALVAANAGLQGTSTVKGNDSAWGYDVGLLFNLSERTKLGLSYRSAVKYSVQGNAAFTAPTSSNPNGQAIINGARASTLVDGPVTLDIKLPATARLAVTQKLGSAFELLGEVSWTQWSSIPELRIKRTNGVTLSNTPEKWEDSTRYALGANYQLNDGVKLRFGAAIDKSPVPDATRTPRLPDNDRSWLSVGAKIKVAKNASVDVGYTHITAKDAALNQNDGNTSAYGLLQGKQDSNIDIVGLQATVSF
jgi:long-chain fatty acid transport protein